MTRRGLLGFLSFQRVTLVHSTTVSSQCPDTGIQFSLQIHQTFYNAKPIFTKPNALLAIKFPGSQCLGTGMTPHWWELLPNYNVRTVVCLTLGSDAVILDPHGVSSF
ncbi:MAG: hypothetical protein ACR5LA_08350 [Wolbachia sp.]